MRILLFLITLVLFLGCKKSKENTTEILCHQEMKERLKSELRCEEKDKLEVNLYSGSYEGQKIFFYNDNVSSVQYHPPTIWIYL